MVDGRPQLAERLLYPSWRQWLENLEGVRSQMSEQGRRAFDNALLLLLPLRVAKSRFPLADLSYKLPKVFMKLS